MEIKLGYSAQMWLGGLKSPFFWDTDTVPHLLISGITGGGKTVLCQTVASQLLNTAADISICDFKAGGDWDNIVPDYAEYTDCDKILNNFYESFLATIKSKGHLEKYLLFDEFSSYAMSKDSKGFKELMAKVSHIAFMGRSFGYHLIFISQQFNAKVLDTAIREQFGIKIYMGSTISTESAAMLFPNCEIDKSVHLPKCCGYISMPEKGLEVIQIPFIKEPAKLKKLLQKKGADYMA
ncbi:hypothetical protein D7V86_10490 [bacterium D16-51]|nr:hypothetical protein D7V96_10485 [bacterium D16-59]RKI60080.1 hypothetical protein D7V86_10490 [bacterium D16-51]